jgi:hypothetical protein
MGALFPVGKKVTVAAKSPVPVAGSDDDHTGKTGRVRGYTDLAKEDVIHVIDLDEPFFVHDANQPQFDPKTGEKNPAAMSKVDWIEVPASCLK